MNGKKQSAPLLVKKLDRLFYPTLTPKQSKHKLSSL